MGPECPADGWPADLPGDRAILFVDDDAPSGGDGASRATALRTIGDALARATNDTIVAIASGTYDEIVFVLQPGVVLWGACAGGTRLTTGLASDSMPHVYLGADDTGLVRISIEASERPALFFDHAASVEDVVIAGARVIGLVGNGGSLTARRLVVRGTRALANGTLGFGVQVSGGGAIVIEDAVVEHNGNAGLTADGAGTTLEARRVVIHDISSATTDHGVAVGITQNAVAMLEEIVVAGQTRRALVAQGEEAIVEARDIVISDSVGMQALGGAHVILERAVVERQRGQGLFAGATGTLLEARDLLVRDVSLDGETGVMGIGFVLDDGANAVVDRAVIEGGTADGIWLGARSHLTAHDVTVRDTKPTAGGAQGEGVAATGGSTLVLERALLERNREASLIATEGSSVEVRDLLVVDTLVRGDGEAGPGVWSQSGSSISLERARVERSTFVAIGAVSSSIVGTEVVASGVARAPCAGTTCPDRVGGFGVAASFGGSLALDGFVVEDAATCGVVVGEASGIDLAHGIIARAPIGACVQLQGFDSERLRNDVEYRDVDVPLQATSYALPDVLQLD